MSSPLPTREQVLTALAGVNDPEIGRPITELGMVKSVEIGDDGLVAVGVYLTVAGCPMRDTITSRVTGALTPLSGVSGVRVELDVMSEEQRKDLQTKVRGGAPERVIPFAQPSSLTKVYAIVSGKGGVGKSRIVLQVAARSAGFPGGKLWVPVASASKDELVAATAAMTIGLPLGADDAASILAAHLAPLGRTLLVIDGCEAVIDGVASLVSGLLSACPLLSAVVTSRVPLSVDTERLVALEPLPSPADGDSAAFAASSQVQLLADRVRDAGGQLEITEEIVPLIAELCRRCGGLPLALELVAAQLTVMSVPDLLDHLSAPEVAGEYQVREVARSSYALLDEDEAAVFRRFAVLDGQVALPFVRAVVAGASVTPVRVVRILRELTARGLLAVDRSGARWRYHQDDELHGFARELLVAGGEEEPAFSQLAAAVARIVPAEPSTPPAPYLEAIGEVLPAVRSLLGAALEGKLAREAGLELAFRLHRYWAATNVTEGRFWLSRLLADAPEPAGPGGQGGQGGSQSYTAHATYALGYLSYWTGDADAAVRELQAAVGLMHGRPDEYTARALIFLGGLADDQDRVADALDFVRRSIVAAAPFAVDLQVSAAIGMGCVLGERAAAQAAGYAAEAISLCRQSGSAEQLAATLPTAATVCWQVGDLDAARRYVSEGLPMLAGTRRIAHVVLLSAAAGVALADDDPDAAVELGAAADAEASDLGIMRELPLVRSVVARAFLQRGAVAAAARQVLGAIDAASSLSFPFPLAVCLETAALVCLAGAAAREPGGDEPGGDDPGGADPGGADPGSDYPGGDDPGGEPGRGGGPGDVQGGAGGGVAGQRAAAATLLAAAAAIRERGDRPGPPSLRGAVAAARAALPAGQPAAPAAAAALAVTALTAAARQPARLASQRGTAGRRGVHQVR